jgi:hypothetical protein
MLAARLRSSTESRSGRSAWPRYATFWPSAPLGSPARNAAMLVDGRSYVKILHLVLASFKLVMLQTVASRCKWGHSGLQLAQCT